MFTPQAHSQSNTLMIGTHELARFRPPVYSLESRVSRERDKNIGKYFYNGNASPTGSGDEIAATQREQPDALNVHHLGLSGFGVEFVPSWRA